MIYGNIFAILPTYVCKLLLAPEVGGYFAPMFGVPLEDGGGPSIVVEPLLSLAEHEEEFLVLGSASEFGLGMPFAQPCERGAAIGIEVPGEVVLLEVGEAEHEGEELTYIVGAGLVGSAMEDLGAGVGHDAPKLHEARIAGAGSIDCQGREERLGGRWELVVGR